MVLKRGFIFALAFLLGIILFLDIVSANLAENASWLDENLTNSNYGTHSTILVGDIDNDGDKDFILSGCTDSNCQNPELTNVYLNNRTSLIINTTWSQNLTAMGSGGGYLADIDNDGDLDLLFTGSAIDFIIYVNNGETFTQNSTWEANVVSNGGGSSDMVLGDIDNDGDLDLVMDGSTNTQTVFLNNGSVFVNNATWGSAIGSASFNRNHMFDYDNDGDLDFILSGFSGGASYFNNGTNFTEDPDGPIGGGERISNTMGDIDNDGDIDYLQMKTPYRAANQPMQSVEELRLVRGFTPEIVDKLRPWIAALPQPTEINVNTAPKEVLSALFYTLPASAIETLVSERPYTDQAKLAGKLQELAAGTTLPQAFYGIKSSYFEVEVATLFGRYQRTTQALIQRSAGEAGFRTLWHSQRLLNSPTQPASEAPPA